jgi:hypothetical protein
MLRPAACSSSMPAVAVELDPGHVQEPFRALVERYRGATSTAAGLPVEWRPIFDRGWLDGSARVLVIGPDPGESETVVGHWSD